MAGHRSVALRLALVAALFGAACDAAPARSPEAAAPADSLHGIVLPDPPSKPDFTLTDTEGEAYDFRAETEGKLALLFVGFTHCPDVCPVHMANLGAVLRDFPYETRRRIEVVFVSADPERDSAERIREWLDGFDNRFVGLRGPIDSVNAILQQLDMPAAVIGEVDERGDYSVGHPAHIVAFPAGGGPARAFYPFGTRQADWAHDLPILLNEAPSASAAAPRPARGERALVPQPPTAEGPAALYVALRNDAQRADALVGAETAVAERVSLHEQVRDGATSTMRHADAFDVAAGDSLRLAPGGRHLMLHGLTRPLAVGDTFTVTLRFRSGAAVPIGALVVPYSMIDAMTGQGGGR